MIFKIEETTALYARREPTIIEASSLLIAKRLATVSQKFYGTVLHIYDEHGVLLTHKPSYYGKISAKWHDH